MWKLKKPSLADAKKDLDDVQAVRPKITNQTIHDLEVLYEQYDTKGFVTDAELNAAVAAKSQEGTIQNLYAELGKNGKLHDMRIRIRRGIMLCPMCSISVPETLDHYMPQEAYKTLAICRLNLVPTCGTCNNLKNEKSFDSFPHVYYTQYPSVSFIEATIHVNKEQRKRTFTWEFRVKKELVEKDLSEKIEYQWNVVMPERLDIAVVGYVNGLFENYVPKTNWGLRMYMKIEQQRAEIKYGLNDWRNALLCAMLKCEELSPLDIEYFKKQHPHEPEDRG